MCVYIRIHMHIVHTVTVAENSGPERLPKPKQTSELDGGNHTSSN